MPTNITNANSVLSSSTAALTRTTTDTITVDFGAYLLSTGNDGLDLLGTSQTYTANINGDVKSYATVATDGGIFVGGTTNTATINIGLGGNVAGNFGIAAAGTSYASIFNAGHVSGNSSTLAAIQEDANGDYTISNSGLISEINTSGTTIHLNGSGTHTIGNSGVISAQAGMLAFVSSNAAAIENVLNTGTINGNVDLGGGNDTLHTEMGTINGTVAMGDGNDTFYGSAVNDTVNGGLGSDTLYGYAGNDVLDGGAGIDTLVGGMGNDTYIVDNAADVVTELINSGTDTVKASVSYVLGAAATSNIENLQTTDATATTAINLTGNAMVNTITGNAGDNILNGGVDSYSDTLIGGAGNDTYIINTSTDKIVEVAGGGTADRVQASVSYSLAGDAHIEFMETTNAAGTAAINLAGNSLLGQTITGNAGNNILNGGTDSFVDTLIGGAGNDTYVLGTSTNDVVVELAGGGTDTITTYSSRSLMNYANVENLTLTSLLASNGTGNDLNNVLTGSVGTNVLSGGLGNDTLNGELGNDTLIGGAGNDTFVFNTTLSAGGNMDTISDFTHSVSEVDMIQLENTGAGRFNALAVGTLAASAFVANSSGVATTAAQHIIYNTTTGALSYDADGNGSGAAIQFASLTGHPTLTNADFIVV